jgi:hypothetical protein
VSALIEMEPDALMSQAAQLMEQMTMEDGCLGRAPRTFVRLSRTRVS